MSSSSASRLPTRSARLLSGPSRSASHCSPISLSARTAWIELSVGDSATRFVLFKPGEPDRDIIGRFFYGALACDDVEATHRQLSERGVEFTAPPTREPWGTFAKFKDPDGNEFVLSNR